METIVETWLNPEMCASTTKQDSITGERGRSGGDIPKIRAIAPSIGSAFGETLVAGIGRMRMSNSDVVIVEDDDLMGSIGKNWWILLALGAVT